MNVYLDFETRSEIDLPLVGVRHYAAHPSTQIICASVLIEEEEKAKQFNMLSSEGQRYFAEVIYGIYQRHPDFMMCAHNAMFERTMWEFHIDRMVTGISVRNWSCSCELGCACGLPPKLEEMAAALRLNYQKDLVGKALMLKMCKPLPKWRKTGQGPKWLEDEESIKRLMQYCDVDVYVDRELHKSLPEYGAMEKIMSKASYVINKIGVGVDMQLAQVANHLTEQEEKKLNKETAEITRNFLDKTSRRAAVMQWCEAQGVKLPDYTKNTIEDYVTRTDIPPKVKRILEIRQLLGKTSVAKYDSIQTAAMDLGYGEYRVYDTLRFNAAMTSRWGGKLVQFQNMPRGNIKNTDDAISVLKSGDPDFVKMMYGNNLASVLSSCVRGVIIPRKGGYKFLVGDYSSIEARMLSWLAGDQKNVDRYHKYDQTHDPRDNMYCIMANKIYERNDIDKKDPRYMLGKQAVLGCGYGMGPVKFHATCLTYKIDVDEKTAAKAVEIWRKENAMACALWRRTDRDAKETVRSGYPHGCYSVIKYNGVKMLRCKLPSGRYLNYIEPEVNDDRLSYMCVDSKTKKWVRADIWGGGLVENIDQAASYDLLAYAVLHSFSKGYPIILTVHDELISEVRADGLMSKEEEALLDGYNCTIFGREKAMTFKYDEHRTLDKFLKIISTPPAWAKGFPLASEGWEGKRYRK